MLILSQGEAVSADTVRLCLPHWDGSTPTPTPASFAAHTAMPAVAQSLSGFPSAARAQLPSVAPLAPAATASERPTNMKDLEREHILATLRELGGSRKKTVEKLGISERSLRYKLQQYRSEGYDV